MPREMENIKSKRGLPSQKSKVFEEMIYKSWWTILFIGLCYFAYDRAICYKNIEEKKLQKKHKLLKREIQSSLANQEDLELQIASQEDEAFIELTLMRRLGLVPEGQTKMHFVKKP